MARTATTTDADSGQGPRVHSVTDEHVLRVVLHGESDVSTLHELDRALADVTLDGARLVHLDLADLAFADVATIRRLAAFTGDAKRAGHEVTTSGAHHTLRTVADLLHAQDDLGLS
jgi:ABC-type transporter Mla MlaB component